MRINTDMSTINFKPTESTFTTSIDLKTIDKMISSPDGRDSLINRIWDCISDFFMGTDRGEAKELLSEIIRYEFFKDDISQPLEAFLKLETLAGESFKSQFQLSYDYVNDEILCSISDNKQQPILESKISAELVSRDTFSKYGLHSRLDIPKSLEDYTLDDGSSDSFLSAGDHRFETKEDIELEERIQQIETLVKFTHPYHFV